MLDLNPMQMVARQALATPALVQSAPAAFAETPDPNRTSQRYHFISTARVVQALLEAGFQPTRAQQTRVRGGGSPNHAKHMIRFSIVKSALTLTDAVAELVLINSHNSTASYSLRSGLYRPVCTNGLVTPIGDFGFVQVAHRGNVIHNVVDGALQIARGFDRIGEVVERMASCRLDDRQRLRLAEDALRLRYPGAQTHVPITADQLLEPRSAADQGNSLWLVFNVIQRNLLAGGLPGRSASGRVSHTRAISQIREDIRLNVGLWNRAMAVLER